MALQDLTPQLRTRLSRVERAVGLFVTLATLLLLAGFAYYIYSTAERKGWFLTKIEYSTSLNNATGLKPGDPVKLMGFVVGEITAVKPNDPDAWYGVTVFFRIQDPNYGYIWTDSKVRAASADFLGNRYLEVIKGKSGIPTVSVTTNKTVFGVLDRKLAEQDTNRRFNRLAEQARTGGGTIETNQLKEAAFDETKNAARSQPDLFYIAFAKYKDVARTNAYWIEPLESPAVTERLEQIVDAVEKALPDFLRLTNQLAGTLNKANAVTTHLDELLVSAQPSITNFGVITTNLAVITSNLLSARGSLGEWLIPTNLNAELEQTLKSANSTLTNTDTNLTVLVNGLSRSIDNLASLTSNLNAQVQVNTNILSEISTAIVHADEMMQGLRRHWLLRAAFKTNKPPARTAPVKTGKGK